MAVLLAVVVSWMLLFTIAVLVFRETILAAARCYCFLLLVVRFAAALSGGAERPRHGQGIVRRARLDGYQARFDSLLLRLRGLRLFVGSSSTADTRRDRRDKGPDGLGHVRNHGGGTEIHFHPRQLLHDVIDRLLVGYHGAAVLNDIVNVLFLGRLAEQGSELALELGRLVGGQLAREGDLSFRLLVVGARGIRHDDDDDDGTL
jgi:hypothetical protein